MKITSDIFLIIGTIVICYGVSTISIAVSIILAGLFIVFFSFAIHKAGK